MEVIQQDKFSILQIANSFKNSNTYVIVPNDDNKVWLVDIGNFKEVESAIGNKQIAGIFLTHAHLDHIYGIKETLQKFPECVVYGSGLCLEYLLDDRKNLSLYYECPLSQKVENCNILFNNTLIELNEVIAIQAFYTPGHTPDSTCYQTGNLIFTGDAYIPGIPTVTKLR
ncbi:MAG: MBL fold metallo-hydrolase, partial [Muribaculum sp.]|nr:MBL fold metallo-hydrolase [Muribaculum sp.]